MFPIRVEEASELGRDVLLGLLLGLLLSEVVAGAGLLLLERLLLELSLNEKLLGEAV